MATDLFSTRTMLQMVQEGFPTNYAWLRDRYFPTRQTFDTKYVEFDLIGKGDRKIAPFVHPRLGGKAVDREGYRTKSYEAPEVAPMMVTTAEDLMKRLPGENPYYQRDPNTRAAEQLARDMVTLDQIITRREEAMCAEALFTGKITIKGDGYDEVIDYWSDLEEGDKPETETTTKWDASGTTAKQIMTDLRDLRLKMIQTGGFTPTEVVLGSEVLNAVLDKLTDAAMLDMRRVDMGQIDPTHLPQGVTYWGRLKDSGLDLYSYDNWYADPTTGTDTPFVPADKALLAAPGARTVVAYGACGLIGGDSVQIVSGTRIPDSWVQRAAPAGRILQMKCRPLPIIQQVYGFHVVSPLTED